jgi:hypothetical protein
VIAATSKGNVAGWLTKRGSELMLQRTGQRPEVIAKNAYDPALSSNPTATKTGLAWEEREGGKGRICFLLLE